jgi:hypothetical protein
MMRNKLRSRLQAYMRCAHRWRSFAALEPNKHMLKYFLVEGNEGFRWSSL